MSFSFNVYTHASYDRAAEQMAGVLDFKESVYQYFRRVRHAEIAL